MAVFFFLLSVKQIIEILNCFPSVGVKTGVSINQINE